jgi:hypothetical protein
MPADTSPTRPAERFDITSFLEGRTLAWGIFEDRFGRLRRRFDVEMTGHWDGDTFVLAETFVYDTGEREARTWFVRQRDNGQFTATCDDCVGEAQGQCAADSITMSYRFRLKLEARTVTVDFRDRIYRMGTGHAVNRATMSKWGVVLGELSLFFHKPDIAKHEATAAELGGRAV